LDAHLPINASAAPKVALNGGPGGAATMIGNGFRPL
jgi:hypothetical protein